MRVAITHRPIYLQDSAPVSTVLLRQEVGWTLGTMGKTGIPAAVWNRNPVVQFLASHFSDSASLSHIVIVVTITIIIITFTISASY
jgi:hypothetical protein